MIDFPAPGMAANVARSSALDAEVRDVCDRILGVPRWRTCEVDWATLRPGVDRLTDLSRGLSGLYCGRYLGQLPLVMLDGELVVCNPYWVIEEGPLPCSMDYAEWCYGYMAGIYEADSGGPLGKHSLGLAPETDFSRGFACGYRDMEAKRWVSHRHNAFNELARRLAIQYPDEHFVGVPAGLSSWPEYGLPEQRCPGGHGDSDGSDRRATPPCPSPRGGEGTADARAEGGL